MNEKNPQNLDSTIEIIPPDAKIISAPVQIRPANDGDVAALADLFHREAEFHESLAGHFRLRADYDWTTLVGFRLAAPGRAVWVAAAPGELCGFIYVRIIDTGATRGKRPFFRRLFRTAVVGSPVEPLLYGSIENLFIVDRFRRRGVAGLLVEEALRWFGRQKVSRVELGVTAANVAGRRFWEKCGFCTHRLLMEKRLP